MDPYIEACGMWADFHDDLIAEMKRALAPALLEHYVVRTGERSYVVLVDSEGKESRPFIPDLGVTNPARESFDEIYETDPEQRLVTCIEVLSPSNKRRGTEGWELYQRKR